MIGGNSDKPPALSPHCHTGTQQQHKSVHSSLKKTPSKAAATAALAGFNAAWAKLQPAAVDCRSRLQACPVRSHGCGLGKQRGWKVLLSRLPLRHNLAGCRGQQRWPYRRRSFLLSFAPHVGQLSIEATTAQQVPGCCLQLSTGGLLHARPWL